MKWLHLSTVAVALAAAGAASAHPKLLSATPAANATVAAPARIELHFSEKLLAPMTGAALAMPMGTGAATHVMEMASTTSVGADGKTIVVQPKTPLTPGSYQLDWHAVSVDTHRVSGTHKFTVR